MMLFLPLQHNLLFMRTRQHLHNNPFRYLGAMNARGISNGDLGLFPNWRLRHPVYTCRDEMDQLEIWGELHIRWQSEESDKDCGIVKEFCILLVGYLMNGGVRSFTIWNILEIADFPCLEHLRTICESYVWVLLLHVFEDLFGLGKRDYHQDMLQRRSSCIAHDDGSYSYIAWQ